MPRKLIVLCLFCAGMLAATTPARASEDVVRIFDNINVGPNETVNDAVCVFCAVHVQGKVDGDLVAIFGDVRLNGEAHHDVVSVFGSVTATGNSSIGGDLVSIFGATRLGDHVTVGEDMVTIFSALHAPDSISVGKDRVAIAPWIAFGPFLILFFVVFLIVHEVQTHRRRRYFETYPPQPRQ